MYVILRSCLAANGSSESSSVPSACASPSVPAGLSPGFTGATGGLSSVGGSLGLADSGRSVPSSSLSVFGSYDVTGFRLLSSPLFGPVPGAGSTAVGSSVSTFASPGGGASGGGGGGASSRGRSLSATAGRSLISFGFLPRL